MTRSGRTRTPSQAQEDTDASAAAASTPSRTQPKRKAADAAAGSSAKKSRADLQPAVPPASNTTPSESGVRRSTRSRTPRVVQEISPGPALARAAKGNSTAKKSSRGKQQQDEQQQPTSAAKSTVRSKQRRAEEAAAPVVHSRTDANNAAPAEHHGTDAQAAAPIAHSNTDANNASPAEHSKTNAQAAASVQHTDMIAHAATATSDAQGQFNNNAAPAQTVDESNPEPVTVSPQQLEPTQLEASGDATSPQAAAAPLPGLMQGNATPSRLIPLKSPCSVPAEHGLAPIPHNLLTSPLKPDTEMADATEPATALGAVPAALPSLSHTDAPSHVPAVDHGSQEGSRHSSGHSNDHPVALAAKKHLIWDAADSIGSKPPAAQQAAEAVVQTDAMVDEGWWDPTNVNKVRVCCIFHDVTYAEQLCLQWSLQYQDPCIAWKQAHPPHALSPGEHAV